MQVLSVPSKSLMDSRWINLGIRTFSPREFLCLMLGSICVVAAASSKAHPIAAVFGLALMVFGFVPFGFFSTEKKIIAFLAFHLKKDNSAAKRSKNSELKYEIGPGEYLSAAEETEGMAKPSLKKDDKKDGKEDETVYIEDLDVPYTLKLKTSATKQFIPVTVYVSDEKVKEIPLASTITRRKGNVFCTVLLESYGRKRVRVVSEEKDSPDVFYDKSVVFARK